MDSTIQIYGEANAYYDSKIKLVKKGNACYYLTNEPELFQSYLHTYHLLYANAIGGSQTEYQRLRDSGWVGDEIVLSGNAPNIAGSSGTEYEVFKRTPPDARIIIETLQYYRDIGGFRMPAYQFLGQYEIFLWKEE